MIKVTDKELLVIKKILQKFVPNCEIWVFGSRITDNIKTYSDLDIVIIDKEIIPRNILFDLKDAFDESILPYRVDILDWQRITPEFRKVIEKNYVVLQKPNN